ncbi:MAG: pseudouridine synthase [Sphingobacteriaceae bacterium]|nr:pseudouridine synthase [Sphingobacteriaceae bacterium]
MKNKSKNEEPHKKPRSKTNNYTSKKRTFSERKNEDSFAKKKNEDIDEKKTEEEEKKSYKQKRSFTRNKEFRSTNSSGFKKNYFESKGDKTHKRPFKRDFTENKFERKNKFEKEGKEGNSESRDSKPKYPSKERSFDSKDRYSKKNKYEGEKRIKYSDLEEKPRFKDTFDKKKSGKAPQKKQTNDDGLIRLNKYLAHSGIASRRDADDLIKSGTVKVNGKVITEMGFKISPTDKVTYGDAAVKNEKKVYLLLNKPKDYISTMDDPQERKTVLDLIQGACRERVYPVGRLDRNTTGLLLLTNDGALTKKLTHPKHGIKKLYHVSLNKGLRTEDFKAIIEGVELEDGKISADDLAFVGEGKKEVGIEIHSGRNRIVRRLFEHLGYEVLKLDRVAFAGLTKKDLPRGKHRFLTQKEISFLNMIG